MTTASLPDSWARCTLGDVIDYGNIEKAEPSDIPEDGWILELKDIEKDTSKLLNRATFAERRSKSTKNHFHSGDVLYGKLRPYLNKVIRADSDGYCSTEILPLRPSSAICGDYLFHWVRSPYFLDYVKDVSHGLSMPRLGTPAGRKAPLVLAPINEQRRIADKLDAVLVPVHACRERLDRIPAILKRFRQAVLVAAASGKLTEDWRGLAPQLVPAGRLLEQVQATHDAAGGHKGGNAAQPTEGVHDLSFDMFPTGWGLLTLRDLVMPDKPITYGILKPGPDLRDGIPYIRVADYPDDLISLETVRRTSPEIDAQFKRSRLQAGDILLSIRGTVGRLGLVPTELEGANITQDSARLTIQPLVNRDYVLWYLRSKLAQDRMTGAVKGVAVRGINIGDVRALQVPVPARPEQDEIVRRVEVLFEYASRLEANCLAARRAVDLLTPALLSKAFRGELVPQDPNDEPASVLLNRIRAEHAAASPKTRGSKGGRRARAVKSAEVSMLKRTEVDENHLSDILKERGPLTSEALWSASQLGIDEFYDQLKGEEARELLVERRSTSPTAPRMLEAAA